MGSVRQKVTGRHFSKLQRIAGEEDSRNRFFGPLGAVRTPDGIWALFREAASKMEGEERVNLIRRETRKAPKTFSRSLLNSGLRRKGRLRARICSSNPSREGGTFFLPSFLAPMPVPQKSWAKARERGKMAFSCIGFFALFPPVHIPLQEPEEGGGESSSAQQFLKNKIGSHF